MIGKLIGAIAGRRAARQMGDVSGPGGALLGIGAAAVFRRLGPVGLLAAAAGGYALKKHRDKHPKQAGPAGAGTSPKGI